MVRDSLSFLLEPVKLLALTGFMDTEMSQRISN